MTDGAGSRDKVVRPLSGRVALVTGGGRGIGAATSKKLAADGAKVAVNYLRNREAAEGVVAAIRNGGGEAVAVQADVREAEAAAEMVSEVTRILGPPDTLVLNADAGGFRPTLFTDLDPAVYESRLIDEMRAAVIPVKAVLPGMVARGRGCIVAVSSALCRAPVPAFSTLAVSKAALEALVRALAVELGPDGIRVVAVEASLTETENADAVPDVERLALAARIPLRRIARADDVAGAIALLASDDARFITGAAVPVTGGQVMY